MYLALVIKTLKQQNEELIELCCNHRIINDRMEKSVKGRRIMHNLLKHGGCAKIS